MISRLHHIEIGARRPDLLISKLTTQFGFAPYAHRVAAGLDQIVLTTGGNVFIIVTDLSEERIRAFETCSPPHFSPGKSANDLNTRVNSVYNVAFEVNEISEFDKRFRSDSDLAEVIQSGAAVDEQGCVRYLTIKSCVGDICHTLIDKSDYKGSFLPSYTLLNLPPANYPPHSLSDLYSHIDHVAFGLSENQSTDVLQWYNRVLRFKRMMTNSRESKKNGYVVMAGEAGLVLRAMIAPKCSPAFSIVLAEPAISTDSGATNNQKLYLEHHGGPGVHHVALCAVDIVRAISRMEEAGVAFVPRPPDTYYEAVSTVFAKSSHPVFVPELKEHGILVDVEKTGAATFADWMKLPIISNSERFILQKFCRPLIDGSGETAFFEIIERRGGAKAFGADNVVALWKALVKQLEKENLEREKQKQATPQASQDVTAVNTPSATERGI